MSVEMNVLDKHRPSHGALLRLRGPIRSSPARNGGSNKQKPPFPVDLAPCLRKRLGCVMMRRDEEVKRMWCMQKSCRLQTSCRDRGSNCSVVTSQNIMVGPNAPIGSAGHQVHTHTHTIADNPQILVNQLKRSRSRINPTGHAQSTPHDAASTRLRSTSAWRTSSVPVRPRIC